MHATETSHARIARVVPGSPADDTGILSGDVVVSVGRKVLHDVIDWRWLSYGDNIELELETNGQIRTIALSRDLDQDWGIEFDDVLFDGTMLCKNNCAFCFMKMLPKGARRSLAERDDDFRLSFTQGNFVTFTNLEREHVERIVEQRLSPLRFSLHASNRCLRERIIGPRAQHGLDIAEELLAAGVQLHAQIVLMPNVNDGDTLRETLDWAWAREGIVNVGIVPVGFTKHQTVFSESFDTPESSQAVLDLIEPYRMRALAQRGNPWVYAADEFYRNAYRDTLLENLPEAKMYADFDLFEDGIGMIRSFVDDWHTTRHAQSELAQTLQECGKRVLWVCGCAQREFTDSLVESSPLSGLLIPLFVTNDYFGGNVDVTGLLCGCDIAKALSEWRRDTSIAFAAIPRVVLNSTGVTLDDMDVASIEQGARIPIRVVSCQPSECLDEIRLELEHGGWCE